MSTLHQANRRQQSNRETCGPGDLHREVTVHETVHRRVTWEGSMSWKVEVIVDDSGEWEADPLRFGTEQEALAYARNLEFRWSAVRVSCRNASSFA